MRKETIDRFKMLFETQRAEILIKAKVLPGDLSISRDDLKDEFDQAAHDIEHNMKLRLKNRETMQLKLMNEALRRIGDGSFGECEGCGEDIEVRRLEAKPTATLCVKCKEEQEKLEYQIAPQYDVRTLGFGHAYSRKFAY